MWTASHIYFEPTPSALAYFAAHPVFSRGLYVVRAMPEAVGWKADWNTKLPAGGLGVVRELLCTTQEAWNKETRYPSDILVWARSERVLSPVTRPALLPEDEGGYKGDDVPDELLDELRTISAVTGTTTSFYHHTMWGGDCEFEFAWVFGSEEIAAVKSGRSPTIIESADHRRQDDVWVLQIVMRAFGVELDGGFFAPHMRAFPWGQYRVPDGVGDVSDELQGLLRRSHEANDDHLRQADEWDTSATDRLRQVFGESLSRREVEAIKSVVSSGEYKFRDGFVLNRGVTALDHRKVTELVEPLCVNPLAHPNRPEYGATPNDEEIQRARNQLKAHADEVETYLDD